MVVCVRHGKYPKVYVEKLRRQVKTHFGEALVCLGDDVPLKSPQGWWCKTELFAPWNAFLRPCVYLDLDTFILDDCRDLLFDTEDLWLIRDFNHSARSNSGVMIIPKDTQSIWDNLSTWSGKLNDGDYLTTQPHKILQDHFAGIVSYKIHCQNGPTGRIICFHGRPKPPDTTGWAKEVWDGHR